MCCKNFWFHEIDWFWLANKNEITWNEIFREHTCTTKNSMLLIYSMILEFVLKKLTTLAKNYTFLYCKIEGFNLFSTFFFASWSIVHVFHSLYLTYLNEVFFFLQEKYCWYLFSKYLQWNRRCWCNGYIQQYYLYRKWRKKNVLNSWSEKKTSNYR